MRLARSIFLKHAARITASRSAGRSQATPWVKKAGGYRGDARDVSAKAVVTYRRMSPRCIGEGSQVGEEVYPFPVVRHFCRLLRKAAGLYEVLLAFSSDDIRRLARV